MSESRQIQILGIGVLLIAFGVILEIRHVRREVERAHVLIGRIAMVQANLVAKQTELQLKLWPESYIITNIFVISKSTNLLWIPRTNTP